MQGILKIFLDKNEIVFNNKKLFNIQVLLNLYSNGNCKYIFKIILKIFYMKDDYCGINFYLL